MKSVMHVNLASGFRGGERQTLLLIDAIAQLYPELTQYLVCKPHSPLIEKTQHLAIQYVKVNHQFSGHFFSPKVDIVHAHDAKAVHWAWLHHQVTKTPYILTRRVPQSVKKTGLKSKTYRQASALVAISKAIQQEISYPSWPEVQLIPSAKAHMHVNSAEVQRIQQAMSTEGQIIIGHAGALVDKHKGQSILIEAAKKLNQQYPNLHFWFLGEGEDRQYFEQQASELTNVHFLGFKNNIADYIHCMNIFAFPSRNEGLGSTLLDVMDLKVPIVAAAVDGIPDIIQHEKTGLLVHANDANALAQAIARLLDDERLIQRLVDNGKQESERYSPERMAKDYVQLYQKLTA